MAKWSGQWCSITDGVEVGLLGTIRWILKVLYTAIVAVQKLYNEIPEFEWWIKLPTGHQIKIVKSDGTLVSDFYTAIPEKKYWAVKWTIFGVTRVKPLPKKRYPTFTSAVIANWDVYIDMPNAKDEDGNPASWGLIGDTLSIIQLSALVIFIGRALKDVGFFQVAKKFLSLILGFIKSRRLKGQLDDIEEAIFDINKLMLELDEEEDQQFGEINDKIGARLFFK